MRAFFNSVLGYFLTPWGLVLMGILDSSVVFFLPLGIDFVVIILTAREPEFFWLYALLATVGSLVGAAITLWVGRKVGQHGLSRFMGDHTLQRVQGRMEQSGAITVAAFGVIPPPFPFTAFLLASGAWQVNPWTFLSTLAGVRLVRFMAEAGLAARYGSGIISWMETTTFKVVVGVLAVLAITGTIASAVLVYRKMKRRRPQGGGAGSRAA